VFRRRSQAEPETAEQALERSQGSQAVRDPQAPKGRPTPKRSEAQANRKTKVSVSKDPKEARKQARARMREERETQRQALLTGDERALPARDRGPVRRFSRDYVDARYTVGEFFLPSAVAILILSILPSLAVKNFSLILWIAVILLIILDSIRVNMGLKKALRAKFPKESLKGITPYALMRCLQLRRLRLPKPQVKRGEKVA
jgi:hypothetical protein